MREADLLLHVVDMAHPFHDNQIEVVSRTLAEIGAGNIPIVLVMNKIDLLKAGEGESDFEKIRGRYREQGFDRVVFISATSKRHIEDLKKMLYEEVMKKHLMIYPNYVGQSGFY